MADLWLIEVLSKLKIGCDENRPEVFYLGRLIVEVEILSQSALPGSSFDDSPDKS